MMKKYKLVRLLNGSVDGIYIYDTRSEAEENYRSNINLVKTLNMAIPLTFILYEVMPWGDKEICRWSRSVMPY